MSEGHWAGAGSVGVLGWLDGEGGECHEWESLVAGVEVGDELCGEGIDVVEVKWGVEWLGERRLFEAGADIGGVTRLDGQDGAGNGKIALVDNCGSSSEIGRNTDPLKDRGQGNKRSCIC
jgi:hypothetical protein